LEGRQVQAGCTCPEKKIGIAEVGALPGGRLQRPFRHLNHQPTGHSDDYHSIFAAVAAETIRQTFAAEAREPSQEGLADSADAAETSAPAQSSPG
jgi:hypothetical protein